MAGGELPIRLSSFLGRDSELTELSGLLSANRLVTLTGPGGGGKTRLALAVASRLRYVGGVHWLGLAVVSANAPDQLLSVVAEALQLPEPALDSVVEELADGPVLLVVDNCEHLLDPVARLIGDLLRRCPELTVLATSQQALGIAGEVVFTVPPLTEAAPRLFVERARAASSTFRATDANAGAIAEISARLDGVPLAIELAAAWVPTLSPAQIAARLDDSLAVLTRGDRAALPRHQTLRNALDWSWNLLNPAEQELLAELSIFTDGFTLDAVEAVTMQENHLEVLSRLVNRSLVMVEQGEEVRYRLLQIVRQYAASRLADEAGPLERLAQYALKLVEQAASKLEGEEQQDWLDRLVAERRNFSCAMSWYIDRGDTESATRLATGLWWPSYLLGWYGDARRWLEQVLALPGPVHGRLRADAQVALGHLAHLQGDAELAATHLRAGFATYREAGDPTADARELHWLGGAAMRRGDYTEARRLGERCIELWRELTRHPDVVRWQAESNLARAIDYLGMRELLAGELDRAETALREARDWYQQEHAGEGLGWTTVLLGGVAHYRGDSAAAQILLTEARRLAEPNGQKVTLAWALHLLGLESRQAGELDESEQLLNQSLRLHSDSGNRWRVASLVEALALTALAKGELERAVRLLGHAAALRGKLGMPVPAVDAEAVAAGAEKARALLSTGKFRAAWTEGEVFNLDKVTGIEPAARRPALTIAETRIELLRIRAFGGSEVHRDDDELGPADWGYAKPRELFFYLLENGPARKEEIGAELWPDASPQTLRNSFHTCLHQVRRALGRSDWISFRGGRYEFNRTLDHWYDVSELERAAERGDRVRVVELYRGDYLPDLDGSWVGIRRRQLRRRFEQALFRLAEEHAAGGRTEEAITLYERAVGLDPALEPAHRGLIALYLEAGDRARAIRQYKLLTDHLAVDLDTVPSPETTALLRAP